MRGRFVRAVYWTVLGYVFCVPAWAGVTLEIAPETATVGDPVSVRLVLDSDDGNSPQRQQLGPDLGPFSVLDEAWHEETDDSGLRRWVWSATVAAYSTGALEFPALNVAAVEDPDAGWHTDPVAIDVVSVLAEGEAGAEQVEIADLKGPSALAPNLEPLLLAGFVLLGLLALAGLLWWLNRRYADRLSAVAAPEDPFARIPPHEWAFAELRRLLEEQADYGTDRFYARLAWILKRYLGGRYRVQLLEHTTDEVRPLLEQAGAPNAALARIGAVLGDCDAVKFAKYQPTSTERKEIVDRVYGIVDRTKPAQDLPADAARAGAA